MSHEARRRLEDLLDREIEVARLLSANLTVERSALTGDASEAVQQQAAEKVRLLGTIERLEGERRALCASAGLRVPGTAANAEDSAIAPTVADRWRALMELMAG